MPFTEQTLLAFTQDLASRSAVPGGGSTAALVGSLSASLGSMAANLTSGKKKYAVWQGDLDRIIPQLAAVSRDFLALMEQDAESFLPLSKAYGIPKTDPDRPIIMEQALRTACAAPLGVVNKAVELLSLLEELAQKASHLVLTDVACAAVCCRCAAESAVLNVQINTNMMTDRAVAAALEHQAYAGVTNVSNRCNAVYNSILTDLRRN